MYKYLNIKLDDTFRDEITKCYEENANNTDNEEESSDFDDPKNNEEVTSANEFIIEREPEPLNPPCTETLIHDKSLIFTPDENKIPLSIIMDEYAVLEFY